MTGVVGDVSSPPARAGHRADPPRDEGSAQEREAEFELLIFAVSSVTWLKIARRSFMSSEIFLLACITVV